MMKLKLPTLLLPILLSIVVAFVTVKLTAPTTGASTKETAFDRIIRTGTIRCGYFLFEPISRVNPQTGKMEGIAIEAMEELAKRANLKVEWTEEVSFGQMVEGVKANRYDVLCTPTWPDGLKSREVEFTTPTFYAGLGIWVRADDTRFDKDWSKINDPAVTISGIDGQIEQVVHNDTFPKAKFLSLPQTTDFSISMLNVATRKADVTFVDLTAGSLYNRNHPEAPLKNIAQPTPLRLFPFSMMVNGGEFRLKNMLDVSSQGLMDSGFMDRILNKYDPKHELYRMALPVRLEKHQ